MGVGEPVGGNRPMGETAPNAVLMGETAPNAVLYGGDRKGCHWLLRGY